MKPDEWEDYERLAAGLTERDKPRLIIPVILWAVIIGLAIGAALYAGKVHAGPISRAMGDNGTPIALRLLNTPCTDEKVSAHLQARVQPQYIPQFKAAVLTWNGKDWASCWIDVQGTVLSIDEEGSPFQPIPLGMFREDSV